MSPSTRNSSNFFSSWRMGEASGSSEGPQSTITQHTWAPLFNSLDLKYKSKPTFSDKHPVPLQDPPDEFKDSLMDTLMEDPVILPASKAVLDRSTINRCVPCWPGSRPTHAPCVRLTTIRMTHSASAAFIASASDQFCCMLEHQRM